MDEDGCTHEWKTTGSDNQHIFQACACGATNTLDKPRALFSFGYNRGIPEGVTVAWGARWIFPDDMLSDRQSFPGMGTPDGQFLLKWLNGGAIAKAKEAARKMHDPATYCTAKERKDPNLPRLFRDEDKERILYQDSTGIIKANPQASHGYLYVCAYLKGE
jgi:hypothetical protein